MKTSALRSLVLFALMSVGFAADTTRAPREEILGDWRGTSKCVNLAVAPSCKDEIVLYHFLPIDGATDRVLNKADKMVNGVAEPMGDLEFIFNAATGCWDCELQNPRVRALWSFTVQGTQLTGTLVQLPDRKLLRKVETAKVAAKP